MPSISSQNVRVVVRLPYNRPVSQEDQIVDPPKVDGTSFLSSVYNTQSLKVDWSPEKADILWKVIEKSRASDSGGADWKGLAAHLEVPLPYLLYRVHARYQEDLRGLQDIPGVSSPISPNAPSGTPFGPSTDQPAASIAGRTLSRLNTRLSPSLGRGTTPLGIRARLNSLGHRDNSSTSSLRHRKATASSSTLTLQTPITKNPVWPQQPSSERPASPPSSGEDEMDSDDDEMLKEEEAERAAEEQDALDKKLADLQRMITGENLGLVSVGRKQGRQTGKQGRELGRGRDDLNRRAEAHHYNASLSSRSASTSQSVSSASSPQGSLPEIPSPTPDSSPQSPQPRSPPLRRHMSPTKSLSPPALSPRSALSQSHRGLRQAAGRLNEQDRDGSEASTGSFSDISDTSLSASALDSALLSNIRGNGSRFSAFARSRFGTSYRSGVPH
ncbi:hypothetical protein J3R30DRAFT_3881854 [Lentinula aciculospora]|uniref:Autophagy-related protein 29 n=1 Tax=Lentinula aciculospora TaxID=153920 RepID=A0A9W9DPR1_9AGAR|nr:hypothetical protein J3R30DRAFT_3881854 [Lentinula aciculospora]